MFFDRLLEFSLRIFESGIEQKWIEVTLKREYIEQEKFFLNMDDFYPAFCLLAGLVAATLSLVLEIVCHNCQRNFSKQQRNFRGNERIIPKRNMKVRFVQVRPIDEEDLEF